MIKTINHICKGTCSRSIDLSYDTETNKITDFNIVGGCNGNLKGIKALVLNRDINEVHDLLKGIKCGFKQTSCPDQISIAIEELKSQQY